MTHASAVRDTHEERLASLQVMRAFAALAVVLHHTLADAASLAAAAGRQAPMAYLVDRLSAGVDLFFVISGFVMVYSSRDLFEARGAAATFLKRRLTRIVPLYWLVTTLLLAVAWLLPDDLNSAPAGIAYVIKSYLFIPAARPDGTIMPVISLGWTLNYEMLFYVLFSFALVLPRRAALMAISGLLLTISAAGLLAQPHAVPLKFWTSPLILEFALGALIAELRCSGARIGFGSATVTVGLGLAVIAFAQVPAGDFERLLAWGFASAVIVGALTLSRASGLLPAFAPLVALGDASYALYLTHPFAMRAMKTAWVSCDLTPWLGVYTYVVAAVATAVLLALATYRFVERPMLGVLRRRAQGEA